MIISILDSSAGFYSQLFFLLNHYLYAEEKKLKFIIDSSNWLFKFNKGWNDYFITFNADNIVDKNNSNKYKHGNVIKDYKIKDYIKSIKDITPNDYRTYNYWYEYFNF
jgi:hypothetical protein